MNSGAGAGLWRHLRLAPNAVVDGDTVRLSDDSPARWGALLPRLRIGGDGSVPVRLAAVDAPESHYPAGFPRLVHQPLPACALSVSLLHAELARLANARVLLQVTGVDRYGRAIGLLWPPDLAAGDPGPEWLAQCGPNAVLHTVNGRLLAVGACYPDFHPDLPLAWLAVLATAVRAARAGGRGLWPLDASALGFALDAPDFLADQRLVLPRLFRRVADFWQQRRAGDAGRQVTDTGQGRRGVDSSLAGAFREFLEGRERPVRALDGIPATRAGRIARVPPGPGASGPAHAGPAGAGHCPAAGADAPPPAVPFADWLILDGQHCRLEAQVENFLYENGCAAEETDVSR